MEFDQNIVIQIIIYFKYDNKMESVYHINLKTDRYTCMSIFKSYQGRSVNNET